MCIPTSMVCIAICNAAAVGGAARVVIAAAGAMAAAIVGDPGGAGVGAAARMCLAAVAGVPLAARAVSMWTDAGASNTTVDNEAEVA